MDNGLKKKVSSEQEHKIASFLGWRVVSGSGARFDPGDISSELWLGDCKTHVEGGHKIEFKLDVWTKISTEALSKFRMPAYFVDDGTRDLRSTWVMIPRVSFPFKTWIKEEVDTNKKSLVFNDSDFNHQDNLYPYTLQGEKVFVCRLYTFSAVAELI